MALTNVRITHLGPRRFTLRSDLDHGNVEIKADTNHIRQVVAERVKIGDTFHPDTLASFPWIAELVENGDGHGDDRT